MPNLQEIVVVNNGYLATPVEEESLIQLGAMYDDVIENHDYNWPEYAAWDANVYPDFLVMMAEHGLAFMWEYVLTEDFSYFAYNFPTEESPNNLVHFRTGKRKKKPRVSKKLLKQYESTSAANELLFRLGTKPHGVNQSSTN